MAGPWVSIRMPTATPRALAAARTSLTTRRTQSCVACDMFRRTMLVPESISFPIISAESVAGPRVAMIFVLRICERTIGKRGSEDKSRLDLWKLRHTIRRDREFFMADIANRYPENIAGKFYVDNQ